MKKEKLYELLSDIDEKYVTEAKAESHSKIIRIKWAAAAACFAIVLLTALALPRAFDDPYIALPPFVDTDTSTQAIGTEAFWVEQYAYRIEHMSYSTYVPGKVISEDKIDEEISEVTVTAGWIIRNQEGLTEAKKLRAKLYKIQGIAKETAIAVKFIDKGDALTTTHYYVVMNPEADLTEIKDYIIAAQELYEQYRKDNQILPE